MTIINENNEGLFRNHKIELTPYQRCFYEELRQKEYKYMITIKLPEYKINGFQQTKNRDEAREQIRILIRDVEKAYTGHKKWEVDGFDCAYAMERGDSHFWHIHFAVITDTLKYEQNPDNLQNAINKVLEKHELPEKCIDLTTVYDQDGLCMYLVKELHDIPRYKPLKTQYSYTHPSLFDLFHVSIKTEFACELKPVNPLAKFVSKTVKISKKILFFIPKLIKKIYKNKLKQSKRFHNQTVVIRKKKRYINISQQQKGATDS